MNKLATLGLVGTLLVSLLACEAQEDKDLEAARACSDAATSMALNGDTAGSITKADECDAFLTAKNLTSLEAQQIRFGIILVQQGKMSQISNMVAAMTSTNTAGINSLNGALSYLVFSANSSGSASSNAQRIKTIGDSLGGGAQMLGGLIYMVTTLSSLGTISAGDPNSVKALIDQCATPGNCTDAQKQAIADAAIAFQAGACSGSSADNATCAKATQIVGGSTDPDTILANLKQLAGTQ